MYKVKIETDSKDTVYHTKSLEGTKKSGTRNLECSQDGINSQLANTPKKKKIRQIDTVHVYQKNQIMKLQLQPILTQLSM